MKHLLFTAIFVLVFTSVSGQDDGLRDKRTIRWARQEQNRQASLKGGPYLLGNVGLRRQEDAPWSPGTYHNLSGVFGLLYGDRHGNFSYELGLNFVYHSLDPELSIPDLDRVSSVHWQMNNLVIPIVVKYDIPIGEQNAWKFGANFTANWIAFPLDQNREDYAGGSGSIRYGYSFQEDRGKFFFKAGIHSEWRFLNTSFLLVQFSRAFVVRPTRTIDFYWNNGLKEGTLKVDSSIEGWMLEFGLRVPLSALF
jgi:hypothetical protein